VSNAVSNDLLEWIAQGHFSPRVREAVDDILNPVAGTSWYTELEQSVGPGGALRQLKEWVDAMRIDEISSSMESIAAGIMHLAASDTASDLPNTGPIEVVTADSGSLFPGMVDCASDAKMVVVLNPSTPRCPCKPPVHADVFSPKAPLGLRAITLSCHPATPTRNRLCLVLQPPGADPATYNLVEFDMAGIMTVQAVKPFLLAGGPFQAAMGVLPFDQVWAASANDLSRDPDRALGAGCSELLRQKVPFLGMYLTALANLLNNHEH